MQYLGINYEMKHAPKLDPTFIPFGVWRAAYLKDAKQPLPSLLSVAMVRFPSTRPSSTVPRTWLRLTTAMLSVM